MKKNYTEPTIATVKFQSSDIMVLSWLFIGDEDGMGTSNSNKSINEFTDF